MQRDTRLWDLEVAAANVPSLLIFTNQRVRAIGGLEIIRNPFFYRDILICEGKISRKFLEEIVITTAKSKLICLIVK